jgi:hypothetical protein
MGIPVDYCKELQIAFGNYALAYQGLTNTMAEQSAACILPCNLWQILLALGSCGRLKQGAKGGEAA